MDAAPNFFPAKLQIRSHAFMTVQYRAVGQDIDGIIKAVDFYVACQLSKRQIVLAIKVFLSRRVRCQPGNMP